jgi:hypothetical protein
VADTAIAPRRYLRKKEAMTEDEEHLLVALAWMCEQYLGSGKADWLDHMCMGAGEDAVALLVRYGLVDPSGRGGTWTEKGKALLATT